MNRSSLVQATNSGIPGYPATIPALGIPEPAAGKIVNSLSMPDYRATLPWVTASSVAE
jgi:hypothetical protein